jgi:hypothetical protein
VFFLSWLKLTRVVSRRTFESQVLVFVQTSTGNHWKRPSECVWGAPPFLRCRSALKDQYSLCKVELLNFLQKMLSIDDAGVTEFIEDLEILSSTNDHSLQDVSLLYKHIELQYRPDWNIR